MVESNINNSMEGLFSNTSKILKAQDYISEIAKPVTGDTVLFPGQNVRVYKNGDKMMETEWFPSGIITNNISLTLKFYINGGTNFRDSLSLIIYKKLPGSSDITSLILEVPYINYISSYGGGSAPTNIEWKRLCTEFLSFNEEYEYKFEVIVSQLSAGATYVDLKYIKLTEIFPTSINAPRQYSLGDIGTYIPMIEGIYWSATTDGAGDLNWNIPLEDNTTYDLGVVRGEYNEIDAVVTGFVSNTDTSTAISSIAIHDSGTGRNTINVKLSGYAAATLVYFYTIIYGFKQPTIV